MRRNTALLTLAVTMSATVVVGVTAPSTPQEEVRAVSATEQDSALTYWTPERMAGAQEMGGVADQSEVAAVQLQAGEGLAWRGATRQRIGTTAPAPVPQAAAVKGNAWAKGGKVSRTVGKVYFTLPSGDYTCTATSVDSANKSTVVTAGHCVYQQGRYATKWVFVPGQTPTKEPYGRWTPVKMYPSKQWVASGDINHDYAFVKLAPRKGRKLGNVVGSLPVSFTSQSRTPLTAFGYSGAAPYYGSRLVYCQGGVVADTYGGSRAEGQACNMVAGASGGPRLTRFDGSAGAVAGVNSFTYSSGPREPMLWASRFGPTARALHTQASR